MKITICELSSIVGCKGYYQREAGDIDYGCHSPVYFYNKNDAYDRLRKAASFFAKDYAHPTLGPGEIGCELLPCEIGWVRVYSVDIPDGITLPEDPSDLFERFDDNGNNISPIVDTDCLFDFPEIESAIAYENGEVIIE